MTEEELKNISIGDIVIITEIVDSNILFSPYKVGDELTLLDKSGDIYIFSKPRYIVSSWGNSIFINRNFCQYLELKYKLRDDKLSSLGIL